MQEHIRAAGLFEWRNGDARQLSKLSASAVIREAESRHPGIKRLSPEKQAKRLAGITGIASQDILDALIAHDDENARNFTQQLRTLQQTRDRL